MNTKYMYSLLAVIVLALISYFLVEAASGFKVLFGVIIPYLAFLIFIVGFINRMMGWARSPGPFRFTTACGQHK